MRTLNLSQTKTWSIHSMHPHRVVQDLGTGGIESYVFVAQDDLRIIQRNVGITLGEAVDKLYMSRYTQGE